MVRGKGNRGRLVQRGNGKAYAAQRFLQLWREGGLKIKNIEKNAVFFCNDGSVERSKE